MERRWSQYVIQARNSKGGRWHFPNAIRKYGAKAFLHEVLEICNTLEEANLAEEKWIEHFDTRNPRKGFNLAKGGRVTGFLDPRTTSQKLSEATKRNMTPEKRAFLSSLRKGKPLSEETKAKISVSQKENSEQIANSNRARGCEYFVEMRKKLDSKTNSKAQMGKKLSAETKVKISIAGRGRSPSLETRAKLSIRSRNPSQETRNKLSEAGKRAVKLQSRDSHGRFLPMDE